MNYHIATLPGDGIGPEVTAQAVKALKAIGNRFGHVFRMEESLVGAAAIDLMGNPYPEATHQNCMAADAVLFGAIGHPKYDNDPTAKVRPEQGLLRMRKQLDLYANIRPVKPFQSLLHQSPLRQDLIEGADLVVVRELISGIYFGQPRGRSEDGETAFDSMVYSKSQVKRIAKLAFEYAGKRRQKLTVVDKANVLATSRLWREVIQDMESDYSTIQVDYMFIDNAAMQMIQYPKHFDVIVTGNMFGDIISDESSVITGSLGLLPSASIGTHTSVFEPIHGSYPQAAGQDIANPIATILSAAILLEMGLNLVEEAKVLREAVEASLEAQMVTVDIATEKEKAVGTAAVGDWIAKNILG
jgi:3-isopropylmalate dehydrogenase